MKAIHYLSRMGVNGKSLSLYKRWLLRSNLADGLGEKELEVWLKICNESEKNIGQKLKKFWDIKKPCIFLHYCLHDSIQNPSYKALQKLCWPVLQILLPSTLFSVLYHTGCFFPATWYTFMFECPWYLSTSAPMSSAWQNATLFLWELCTSPLSHLHSPHPTSTSNCLFPRLFWFFQYLLYQADIC